VGCAVSWGHQVVIVARVTLLNGEDGDDRLECIPLVRVVTRGYRQLEGTIKVRRE
jgi:hypothetical protein